MKKNNNNDGLSMKNNNNNGLSMKNNNNNNGNTMKPTLEQLSQVLSDMMNKKGFAMFSNDEDKIIQEMIEDKSAYERNVTVLRAIQGLPVQNKLRTLQIKAEAVINDEWTNVELEDSSLYNGHKEFIYMINHAQDVVEKGTPAQVHIYCNIDEDEIRVAKLAKTYVEDSNFDMEWDDLEEHTFSWETVSEMLVKYHDLLN